MDRDRYPSRSGCALALALAAILLIQGWAGVALRGLYADGAYYAEQLLLRQSFAIIEPSRWTSQVLIQTPVVVAMWLGQDSPHAVALAFSMSSNLVPLALTLACVGVLPSAERRYGLFPVLIFLAASMSATFASVADGPTAAAYAWALLLLILFGPPTRWRLGGILLLATGAVRLHEAMAFLGPILVVACAWQWRSTRDRWSRIVLALAGLLIATGCVVAVHDGLHPRVVANRVSLVEDLVSLRWLLIGFGQINVMALAGLVSVLVLPVVLLRPAARAAAMSVALVVFTGLAALALGEPPCPPAAFAARDNACLLTAPAMVLLLMLRGRRWPLPAASTTLMAMLGLVIAIADATATTGWLGYTRTMQAALTSEHGVVPWREALATLPAPQASALRRYAWPWTTPLMSVWLSPGSAISTIIANPPGTPWQPFDPDAIPGALAGDRTSGRWAGRGRLAASAMPFARQRKNAWR